MGGAQIEVKRGNCGSEWTMKTDHRVLHYPRLDTVMMVAEALKKCSPTTKTALSRKLKKPVMWPTLTLILDYFETMGFIMTAKNGKIVWVYDPEGVKKYLKRDDLKWEPR